MCFPGQGEIFFRAILGSRMDEFKTCILKSGSCSQFSVKYLFLMLICIDHDNYKKT